MRTLNVAVVIGGVVLAAGTLAVPSAGAPASPATGVSCQETNIGLSAVDDIDNDGYGDVVIGVPRARAAGKTGAGAVDIHYRTHTQHFDESLFSVTPGASDAFGSGVAFVAGRCDGLAIGAPGALGGRGRVVVAFGSDGGIVPTGAITLTGRTAGEHFGAAVISRGADLWVSAPDRTVDGARSAGAVDHYRLNGNGTATLVQSITQNTPGVPGGAETDDRFGQNLAVAGGPGALLIGDPDEDVGTQADAGSVTAVYSNSRTGLLSSAATFTQNTPGVPGNAEAGDRFGASVGAQDVSVQYGDFSADTRVAVGVPDETIGAARQTGTVDTFEVRPGSGSALHPGAVAQSSPGVPGSDENYDHFGAQVIYADGLCIGVPGEDLGAAPDAGRVLCDLATGWQVLGPGSTAGSGDPQTGAGYGTNLGPQGVTNDANAEQGSLTHDGQSLVTAAPGATSSGVAAGMVTTGAAAALTDSTGPVANERYGIPAVAPSQPQYDDID